MDIRDRMKSYIEDLKQLWEKEAFVRKGQNNLVRVTSQGLDIITFTPPGNWRMDILVGLGSWHARLEAFYEGTAIRWPRKRFALPGRHFSTSVTDLMGLDGTIGEREAVTAGFRAEQLAEYIWTFSDDFSRSDFALNV